MTDAPNGIIPPLASHKKILFIGNSHTYLHKMPWLVKTLADHGQKQDTISVALCTQNRAGLKEQWHDRNTRDTLTSKAWDVVVLQDRSGGPLEEPSASVRYADLFCRETKRCGAKPFLFMTWAHRDRPQDQDTIAEHYAETAYRNGADLVPVGLAWRQSIAEKPNLNLYHQDGRHAGPAGAYLAACVFYTILFKASPAKTNLNRLPSKITIQGKLRVNLDPQPALFLQQIAFQTGKKEMNYDD